MKPKHLENLAESSEELLMQDIRPRQWHFCSTSPVQSGFNCHPSYADGIWRKTINWCYINQTMELKTIEKKLAETTWVLSCMFFLRQGFDRWCLLYETTVENLQDHYPYGVITFIRSHQSYASHFCWLLMFWMKKMFLYYSRAFYEFKAFHLRAGIIALSFTLQKGNFIWIFSELNFSRSQLVEKDVLNCSVSDQKL